MALSFPQMHIHSLGWAMYFNSDEAWNSTIWVYLRQICTYLPKKKKKDEFLHCNLTLGTGGSCHQFEGQRHQVYFTHNYVSNLSRMPKKQKNLDGFLPFKRNTLVIRTMAFNIFGNLTNVSISHICKRNWIFKF